jgi:hypothetical protein
MSGNAKDTARANEAVKAIIDGRNPFIDAPSILVTAEHTFAVILLACMKGDARKAAGMLTEGLVPGIEQRLAYYASKGIKL